MALAEKKKQPLVKWLENKPFNPWLKNWWCFSDKRSIKRTINPMHGELHEPRWWIQMVQQAALPIPSIYDILTIIYLHLP